MKKPDEELILLCAERNESAFNELYGRYKDKLFSFICQYVENRHTGEDIFQETFFRIVKHAGRFNKKKKFSSWIYTIAANLCRDELKRRKRRIKEVSLEKKIKYRPQEDSGVELKENIRAKGKSPREELEAGELTDRMAEAVARLPVLYRIPLELNVREELKYREVAQVLKLPLGTVKSRIHKAVQMLRKDMEKYGS